MHVFHDYLAQQLDEMLNKHSIVVFYDPRREFEPLFARELKEVGTGYDGLPRVFVEDRLTFVAQYEGSYFALRAQVEPIIALDRPDPLIVYVPGVSRDRQTSILMELEKAGTAYEPRLKRLALNVLRKRFTDGQIDEMLRPASLGYDDVVSFLHQGEEGKSASVLRTIFDGAQSEALVTRWLVEAEKDAAIAQKDGLPELLKLIETRLGLTLAAETPLVDVRERLLRYVLVGEFRSDLECPPPASVAMVPVPPSGEHVSRIRDVAESLRRAYAAQYVGLAGKVEADLGLSDAQLDASHLGNIDTFRFEERALLAHAGNLISAGQFAKAIGIVAGRSRSFWVDRDVARQSQWESCRLMAELGRELDKVRPALNRAPRDPSKWVQAYAAEDGWYRIDELQRRLETWVAKMDDDPEIEKGLAIVRREHEELLKKMADGFASVLEEAGWAVPGALHQTHIYPEVVQAMGGSVAYFFVDAMRFEMGVELARQLEGAKDVTIRPAIAALPTITPVGMAALLPGASASFSVVEHKGRLGSRIEGASMAGLGDRQKFLKAKVPDVVDLTLDDISDRRSSDLSKRVAGATLIVVRSQEIDALGENVQAGTARSAMANVIGNIRRAIKKLARLGVENFVITADHGHQFAIRKDDDMKTDNPGGKTVDLHRRCWIGHGGTTPPGTARVTGAELGYDTDLDFVFPTGLGVFKAGGGLSFHHGGVSLQELVIPVVTLRFSTRDSNPPKGRIAYIGGLPAAVTNRTFAVQVRVIEQMTLGASADETVTVRILLVSNQTQVGQAGMALGAGAKLDRASGLLSIAANGEATVGLLLTTDEISSLRVVVLDPTSDAVLAESDEIPVKLGM
jgi:hypothetical protein